MIPIACIVYPSRVRAFVWRQNFRLMRHEVFRSLFRCGLQCFEPPIGLSLNGESITLGASKEPKYYMRFDHFDAICLCKLRPKFVVNFVPSQNATNRKQRRRRRLLLLFHSVEPNGFTFIIRLLCLTWGPQTGSSRGCGKTKLE